ncbi:MAG: right-handed parallel beta-helix repeat-containing protein [Parapedobacter sp.]|nr:MAG: right-handed parallel beta-helix repeat-containing protein [Parapedobacter sp.]
MKKPATHPSRLTLLTVAFTALTIVAHGQAIHYVVEGGAGTQDGTSWANAFDSPQHALDAAVAGDHIWVAAGTYRPIKSLVDGSTDDPADRNNTFLLKRNVKLYGGFAGNEPTDYNLSLRDLTTRASVLSGDFDRDDGSTIDDPRSVIGFDENAYHVVVSAGSVGNAELNGFVIRGGNANGASAAYLPDLPDIPQQDGGGILTVASSPVLTQVYITANTASGAGGGLAMLGQPGEYTIGGVLQDCHVFGNIAGQKGGGLFTYYAAPSLHAITIYRNCSLTEGGGIFIENSTTDGGSARNAYLANVVIAENSALGGSDPAIFGGGGACVQFASPTIIHTTIYKNTAGTGASISLRDAGSEPLFMNSIIWDNLPSAVVSIANPWTASPTYDHCLIKGSPSAAWVVSLGTDLGGNIADAPNVDETSLFRIGRLLSGSPGIDAGDNGLVPLLLLSDRDGKKRINGTSVDIDAYEFHRVWPDIHGIIYVNDDPEGGDGSGSSWANACTSLSYALDAAKANAAIKQIWVAGGTYHPHTRPDNGSDADSDDPYNTFLLPPDVKIYGTLAGNEPADYDLSLRTVAPGSSTVLRSASVGLTPRNYHIIMAVGDVGDAVIDGFVISGAEADGPDAGGITVNGLTVSRLGGGGIYIHQSAPTLSNLMITANRAAQGGGVFISESAPALLNCIISGNEARRSGGAIYAYQSTPQLVNLTIVGNTASGDTGDEPAAIYNVGSASSLQLYNSIIWNNGTSISLFHLSGGADIAHSIIEGAGGSGGWMPSFGNDLGGNLDTDPLFDDVTGMTLLAGSPAINAGNQSLLPPEAPRVDFSRKPRVYDGEIDMGAFERIRRQQVIWIDPPRLSVGGTITATYGDVDFSPAIATDLAGISTGADISYTIVPGTIAEISATQEIHILAAGSGETLMVTATGDPEGLEGGFDPTTMDFPLEILQKSLILRANDIIKTYGETITFAGTEFTVEGLVAGDNISGATILSTGAMESAPVADSPYPVTIADAMGTGLANYVLTYMSGQLTVDPAALTVTATDDHKVYDGLPYVGGNGISYSGFVAGDDPAAIDESGLDYGGDSQGATEIGSYPIAPYGLSADNYVFDYVSGTLTIGKALVSGITFNASAFVYDGSEHVITITGELPPGTSVTYDDHTRTNVGSQLVTATIHGGTTYEDLILTATLTITEPDYSTVVFDDATYLYDGSEHRIEASGVPTGTTMVYTNNAHTDAGMYSASVSIQAPGGAEQTFTATLTITKATIPAIGFDGATFVYDGTEHTIVISGSLPRGLP